MSYILHIEPQGNVAMKLPKPKIIKRKKKIKEKNLRVKRKPHMITITILRYKSNLYFLFSKK